MKHNHKPNLMLIFKYISNHERYLLTLKAFLNIDTTNLKKNHLIKAILYDCYTKRCTYLVYTTW